MPGPWLGLIREGAFTGAFFFWQTASGAGAGTSVMCGLGAAAREGPPDGGYERRSLDGRWVLWKIIVRSYSYGSRHISQL